MSVITRTDYERMSWHQKARINERLRTETARLTAELERLTPRVTRLLGAERTQTEARRILAALPPDPDAAGHRFTLNYELTHPHQEGQPPHAH